MEYVWGLYWVGVFIHFVIGLATWGINEYYEDTSTARNGAKLVWLSPVWPLLWLYWIGLGIYKAFRYAWIDQ